MKSNYKLIWNWIKNLAAIIYFVNFSEEKNKWKNIEKERYRHSRKSRQSKNFVKMIHQDHNILKASLIAYHGHLLATFFYDYVVRNCVRMFFYQIEWSFLVGIVLGILFSMVIIWSIVVVYKSNSVKQVTISLILLCIIFLTKLTTGVLGLVHSNGK